MLRKSIMFDGFLSAGTARYQSVDIHRSPLLLLLSMVVQQLHIGLTSSPPSASEALILLNHLLALMFWVKTRCWLIHSVN